MCQIYNFKGSVGGMLVLIKHVVVLMTFGSLKAGIELDWPAKLLFSLYYTSRSATVTQNVYHKSGHGCVHCLSHE